MKRSVGFEHVDNCFFLFFFCLSLFLFVCLNPFFIFIMFLYLFLLYFVYAFVFVHFSLFVFLCFLVCFWPLVFSFFLSVLCIVILCFYLDFCIIIIENNCINLEDIKWQKETWNKLNVDFSINWLKYYLLSERLWMINHPTSKKWNIVCTAWFLSFTSFRNVFFFIFFLCLLFCLHFLK